MENSDYSLDQLPGYLRHLVDSLPNKSATNGSVEVPSISSITTLDSWSAKYSSLLLRRHFLTKELGHYGLHPPLIHQRALVYEALGYADLAAADAFVTYTLCTTVRSKEWFSDLEPVELNGEAWPSTNDPQKNLAALVEALVVLCRALLDLGAREDAEEKLDELADAYGELVEWDGHRAELLGQARKLLRDGCHVYENPPPAANTAHITKAKFGWARREIYPWNELEPDRNSAASLSEINSMLSSVSKHLTAKVTVLPALKEDGSLSDDVWHQLGLFAKTDLAPGTEILAEDSLLTAIRPLDDALCDACGADLESVDRAFMRQCPGEDCDTTFCSKSCATRAANEYHKPNISSSKSDDSGGGGDGDGDEDDDEESQSDYPPSYAPFCGNTALHEIGRTSSTTTAEWDLYFLLLTRTIQMSTTQSTHPLSLSPIKYLWGDFTPTPSPHDPTAPPSPRRTLPWSLHHNLTLPLQYFETLMLSVPACKPYSGAWLARHDWWIQSTLLAKFRGVANAQQSTFDGRAEIAAVHPCWCLANHSCAPNVRWTPTGTRRFVVREGGAGIRAGQEVWSHYTDVRLGVTERRERLMEVLGGVCRCERCMKEGGEV